MNAYDLEKLIDETSLAKVVEMLSGIAGEKAEHIRVTWQDYGLARKWDNGAKQLDTLSAKLRGKQL